MAHFVYPMANSGQPAYAAQTAYVAAAPQASPYAAAAAAPRTGHTYETYQAHTPQFAYATRTQVGWEQPHHQPTYEQTKTYYQQVQATAPYPTSDYQQATAHKIHQPSVVITPSNKTVVQGALSNITVKPAYSTSTYAAPPRQSVNQKPANVQVTPSTLTSTFIYPTVTTIAPQPFSSNSYVVATTTTASIPVTSKSSYESALYTAATNYYQQWQQTGSKPTSSGWKGGNRSNRGGFNRMSKGPSKNQQVHYCDVCKVSCAGPLTYREHVEGQKHKKKEAANNITITRPSYGGRTQNQLRCELCEVTCTGNDAYNAHVRGVKHKKVVRLHTNMGKPIPSNEPTVLNKTGSNAARKIVHENLGTTSATVIGGKKVLGTPKINFVGGTQLKTLGGKPEEIKAELKTESLMAEVDDDDEICEDIQPVGHEYLEDVPGEGGKGISFHCKLCDCKFNDPNAKEMHMKGKRHRLMYKKKVDPKLQVDIKPNSSFRRLMDSRNRRLPKAGWKRQEKIRLMDEFRMEEQMYWMHRRRVASELEHFEMQNDKHIQNMQRNETSDDRHVMTKHNNIYPEENELQAVQNIVSVCEKSLKLVSDALSDSNKPKEEVKEEKDDPKLSKDGGETSEKKESEPDPPAVRVLKGVMRVGVLAKGLLLHNNLNTHLVVLCSEKPSRTLLQNVADNLPKQIPLVTSDVYETRMCIDEAAIVVSNTVEPHVTCTVTFTSPTMREATSTDGAESKNKDPPDVLDRQKCLAALAALRHAKWFQARANTLQSCVMVIRVMRDLCQRVPTWVPLSQWALELLVEKCLNSVGMPVLPGLGLRRVFEAIASGILLPGGPGISDPCEKEPTDAAAKLTNQQREEITASAQHALRLIAFHQIHKVLGMDPLPMARPRNKVIAPQKRPLTDASTETAANEKNVKVDEPADRTIRP